MKGKALQVTILKSQSEPFEFFFEEKHVYVVFDFRITKSKNNFNAISALCTIKLTLRTKDVQIKVLHDSIPKYYFQFLEFEQLPPRCKHNVILIGTFLYAS